MAAPAKRSAQSAPPAPVELAVADLQVDAAIQPREFLNPDVIDAYATLYREVEDHEPLPPLDVFHLDGAYYLADGFHRAAAAQKAQRPTVLCRVYQGTRQDAIRHAALANLKRGLRYTSGDRERVLERLLQDPEVRQRSDRQLAADLEMSHMTVNRARRRLAHIATLTEALEAQPTTATTPAAKQQEQLASFLEVPVEQVARLATHPAADRTEVIHRMARTMADQGKSAPEARSQAARTLASFAEYQARADAGQVPRRPPTAAERERRRANTEREQRYLRLCRFLRDLAELDPSLSSPEDDAHGEEEALDYVTAADLIAAAESYIVANHLRDDREHIVEQLQRASRALDALKAACIAQRWDVPF
jgi:uncharacterized ParB-like nuclease family protein/phage terminase small subunit